MIDRSHALRGNASRDAPRSSFRKGRGASRAAFPRRAWERSTLHYSDRAIISFMISLVPA
ncbi:hypothetical protein DM828_17850 [Pseudomonas umsongensis]|nr:hypothetical protein [Pseudomonas umsongensis]